MKHKVEGQTHLVRDTETNCIINTSKSQYNEYVSRRNKQSEEKQKIQQLETDVSSIKNPHHERLLTSAPYLFRKPPASNVPDLAVIIPSTSKAELGLLVPMPTLLFVLSMKRVFVSNAASPLALINSAFV